jgi:hypothetical protein
VVFEYEYETLADSVPPERTAAYLKKLNRIDAALGYSLWWENEEAPLMRGALNWAMVFIAGLYSLFLVGGVVAIHRHHSPLPASLLEPGAEVEPSGPSGIGGWLILVAIGLILTPFRVAHALYESSSLFSLNSWHELTVPGGSLYHPAMAPYCIFSILGNLTLLACSIVVASLFFNKRRTFPRLYICLLVGGMLLMTIDYAWGSMMPPTAEEMTAADLRQVFRGWIACLIWVPYTLVSKRVRATFIH